MLTFARSMGLSNRLHMSEAVDAEAYVHVENIGFWAALGKMYINHMCVQLGLQLP